MSIQWMDDFNGYAGTIARMLDGTPWIDMVNSTLNADPDPSAAGTVLRVNSSDGVSNFASNVRIALPTPAQKVGIACRLWLTTLPNSGAHSFSFHWMTGANAMKYHFSVRPNGSIQLYRGASFGARVLVADSVAPVLFAGAWNHLEFWIDVVTGNYYCWKEGVPVAALTGVDGAPLGGTTGIVSFADEEPGAGATNTTPYIKDLVVMDGLGTTNNAQIGPVTIYRLSPLADVSGGWTPSTGASNAACIDEDAVSDVDYISAVTPAPAAELMTLEDLPAAVVAVRGVMLLGRMKKSDGGDGNVQMGIKSGASTGLGTDRAISTAFAYYWDVKEFDPATGVAWTPGAVNGAQVQVNRTL
jgi:hypothetical protein